MYENIGKEQLMPFPKVQNYFGQVQIVLDPSKHFWNDQNILDFVQNMKFSNEKFFGSGTKRF